MVGGTPSASAGMPIPSVVSPQFQNELKSMTDLQLKDKLKDPSLTDEQRNAVIDELARRKSAELKESHAAGNDQAGEDDDELQQLLKKFKNKTATKEDKEKLAKMLNVDVKDLDKAVPK
jgi:hypothetical protein